MSYATYSLLKDVTDIWLTDYKFYSSSVAMKYANAADYPDIAYETLCKMVEDTGEPSRWRFNEKRSYCPCASFTGEFERCQKYC